jgi:hypothetical protein
MLPLLERKKEIFILWLRQYLITSSIIDIFGFISRFSAVQHKMQATPKNVNNDARQYKLSFWTVLWSRA